VTSDAVFISYARTDAKHAEALERALARKGVKTWRDKSQIERDWSREIAEALAASSACCVLWTDRATTSKWVRHEWLTARALGKPVHLIAPTTIPPLPAPLQNADLVLSSDASAWADRLLGRLASANQQPIDFTIVPPGSSIPFLPNPRFTGRATELLTLYLTTIAGLNKVGRSLVGLVGFPGTGKTQLAVEFGYRFAFAFDRVLWLQGADPTSLRTQLARMARELIREPLDPADEGGAVRRLGSVFSSSTTLLIVDNVDDPLALNREGVLGVDVPGTLITLGASVLYTSRRTATLPAGEQLTLREIDEAASLRLLTADRAPRDPAESAAAHQILQLVAGLPLALALLNGYLRSYPDVSYRDLSAALQKRKLSTFEQLELTPAELATRHDVVLTATLERHIDSLRNEQARSVLQLIAMQGESAAVPLRRLELFANFQAAEATLVRPFPRAITELERLNLVERLSSERVRMHPLTRTFIRERSGAESLVAIRTQASRNVRTIYGAPLQLSDEIGARGPEEAIEDLEVAEGWAERESPDRLWLGTMRRVLERERHHLVSPTDGLVRRAVLQQLAWRCVEMSHPELAAPFEEALNATGEVHIVGRAVTPQDDPALLRQATQRPDGMLEGRWDHLSMHPSGTLVTWGWNAGVVWDVESLRPRLVLSGGSEYLFAAEISAEGDRYVTVDSKGVFRRWDVVSGTMSEQVPLEIPRQRRSFKPTGAAISAQGDRIVMAFDNRHTFDDFDASSARGESLLATWRVSRDGISGTPRILPLEAHWLNIVGLDETGEVAAVSGERNGTVTLYDLNTGRRIANLEGYQSSWKVQSPNSFAFSMRRRVIIAQICDDLCAWDIDTGSISYLRTGGQSSTSLALDRDSNELITAGKNTITRWDLSTRTPIREYAAVDPASATVDATRRLLVSGGADGYIATWTLDAPPPTTGGHGTRVLQIGASQNRDLITLAESELLIWSNGVPTGSKPNDELQLSLGDKGQIVPKSNRLMFGRSISATAIDPTGRLLLIVSSAGDCRLHSIDNGAFGPERMTFGAKHAIVACGFADHGRLAVAATSAGHLIVVDVERQRVARTIRMRVDGLSVAAFARDATQAIVGSEQGQVRVVDLITEKILWSFDHEMNRETRERYMDYNMSGEAVNVVDLGAAGRVAVMGFVDDQPLVVNLSERLGRPRRLIGHSHIVWSAAVSTGEDLVLTGGQDRTMIVWNAATCESIAQIRLDAPISAIGTADNLLALGDQRGRVHLAELRAARAVSRRDG
jgi:WD40 repeat protein